MLTINAVRSAKDARSYYAVSDYFLEGESQETVGRWGGKLAADLGLEGTVDKARFDMLCDNINPLTGDKLTQRTRENRRVAYDLTFSTPKSFSIVEALAPETERRRLFEAFDASVAETMKEVEADMMCRVRAGGQDTDRVTGNMVWAEYDHSTARPVRSNPPDMHRHKHVVCFSATYDPVESKIKAGQFGDIKRDGEYYDAVFYSKLASRLEEMGYRIDRRGGKAWEISGLSKELLKKFSKRTDQVEDKARKDGITGGARKGELGAKTRSRKQKSLTQEVLRGKWQEQLDDADKNALARVYGKQIEADELVTPEEAVRFAIEHLSEQRSVFAERDVKRTALLFGLGDVTPEAVDWEMRQRRHGLIVQEIDGRQMATTEQLQREEDVIIGIAARGLGSVNAVGVPGALERGKLNDGQWAAVTGLLESENKINLVLGPAGAGKTELLKTYDSGMAMKGRTAAFLATTSDAVEILKNDGFDDAATVSRFLLDERLQASLKNGYVVCDEVSMLGHKEARKFFELADRLNLQVTLVGDEMQHTSVPRGALTRILKDYAGLKAFRLSAIMRQRKNPGYMAAVELLSEGRTVEGFDSLNSLGYVREIAKDGERYRALAAEYVEAVEAGESCIVVAPTHREAALATQEIRSQLRDAGIIDGKDREFTRLIAVHASVAERGLESTYQEGDIIEFHQAAGGFKKGQRLVVADAAEVPLAEAEHFSLYRRETIGVARGDRIRFTGSVQTLDGKHTLKNGTVRTVAEITKWGRIRLDNGWVISGKDAGHFRHGVVDTSFGAQGKTVQKVLLSMSEEAAGAMNQENLYVGASRGRKAVTLFTNSSSAVRRAIQRSSQRMAAVDLRRAKPAKGDLPGAYWQRHKRQFERRGRMSYIQGLTKVASVKGHELQQAASVGAATSFAQRVLKERQESHER